MSSSARLEDLAPGINMAGLAPDEVVSVLAARWTGRRRMVLTYRTASGVVDEQVVYRRSAGSVALDDLRRAWSFTGHGALFRLVSEARRIRVAYLLDPRLAVDLSFVESLPQQILAVYGEPLRRGPQRFCLADDPGAGKPIMARLRVDGALLPDFIAPSHPVLKAVLAPSLGSDGDALHDGAVLIDDTDLAQVTPLERRRS